MENDKTIPDIIIGRLPRYLRALREMRTQGESTTSSHTMGERLGISAAQIRKDLSQFGEFGKQGTGYPVNQLIDQLSTILNINRVWDMALVGAGDLGRAIANYPGFKECGFRVSLVFDNNPQKIGTRVGPFIIQDMADLERSIRSANIRIAMITVPSTAAQNVAECLVNSGVRAILNYAPTSLLVPEYVHVQYIDPVMHLQRMTYYLD